MMFGDEASCAVNIPEEDLPILHALMEMPQASFDALVPVINETPATISARKFADAVLLKLKDFPQKGQVYDIFEVISALYYLVERAGVQPDRLAASISRSAVESSTDELQFPEEKEDILRERLKTLLSFDKTLGTTAKALDVMTETERTFCGARILSDIRPVFSNAGESTPAALIIHNLQIAYHNSADDRHSEIYFTLDTSDIATLKEVLERAEKKTKALEQILKRSNTTYLEV